MTKKEALEQGYTRAAKDDELIFIKDWDGFTEGYMLLEKVGKPYKINEGIIECLVTEYLYEQDEIGDEEGVLAEVARDVDYSDIVNKLNEAFSVYDWYGTTDIELTPGKLSNLADMLDNISELTFKMSFVSGRNIYFKSKVGSYEYFLIHDIDRGESKVIYPEFTYLVGDLSIISVDVYRNGILYKSYKK